MDKVIDSTATRIIGVLSFQINMSGALLLTVQDNPNILLKKVN